ncbi:MAG TPA: hypothetical protein VMX11_00690 [Actinomycetes bacterium]|nr:hypothetical protein [Actinomycetes bacterium]
MNRTAWDGYTATGDSTAAFALAMLTRARPEVVSRRVGQMIGATPETTVIEVRWDENEWKLIDGRWIEPCHDATLTVRWDASGESMVSTARLTKAVAP